MWLVRFKILWARPREIGRHLLNLLPSVTWRDLKTKEFSSTLKLCLALASAEATTFFMGKAALLLTYSSMVIAICGFICLIWSTTSLTF